MAVELGGRLGDARHGAVCGTPLEPRNSKSGRGDWIRTSDPLRPRQVRYQAALRPDSEFLDSKPFVKPGTHAPALTVPKPRIPTDCTKTRVAGRSRIKSCPSRSPFWVIASAPLLWKPGPGWVSATAFIGTDWDKCASVLRARSHGNNDMTSERGSPRSRLSPPHQRPQRTGRSSRSTTSISITPPGHILVAAPPCLAGAKLPSILRPFPLAISRPSVENQPQTTA